jgi:hypothetical protein
MLFFPAFAVPGNAAPQKNPPAISLDYPGAVETHAMAITPSGDIVGRYTDTVGVVHGFLLHDKQFSSIDYPASTYTEANWINPRGEIGGDYGDSSGVTHGFVLWDGQFTTIDYPGAASSSVFGITAKGKLVGVWLDDQNVFHGFLDVNGQFSPVDVPGAVETLPGMMARGVLVGGYFGDTGTYGFDAKNGNYNTVECPGATFTFLSGIDGEGDMVGQFGTADGNAHGALIKNGNCIQVDFPKGFNTYANGSDAQGDIVGSYTDKNAMTHGFLLPNYIATATPVYSAAAGFSANINPNSVWSYGYANDLVGSYPGPFNLYPAPGVTYNTGEVGWFGPIAGCCAPGYPFVAAQPEVIPTTLDLAPGLATFTVVRWTAPNAGDWDVVGSFAGMGTAISDVHVVHNGVEVFSRAVNGSGIAKFSLEIYVKAGDTIDFDAGPGPGGNNSGEPIALKAVLTPDND